MAGISKNWNGKVFGTNTGNVSLALTGEDNALSGSIRLSDDRFGVVVYNAAGTFSDGALALTGKPSGEIPEQVQVGELTVSGALTAEGRIDGQWSTTIGTGGTFQLWPHSLERRVAVNTASPEQSNMSVRTVGAVRLYADDVRTVIEQILKEFTETRAVITYYDNGNEKTLFSHEFASILDELPELRYLKISVQEHEKYGINKLAMVEFAAWGENVIRVQSVQETWAIGKSEALSRHISGFQRKLATRFRKYGLNVNIAVTVVALAALPGLVGFGRRLIFAASVWALQGAIGYLHRQYVPNFILYPAKRESTLFGKIGPGMLSWGITIMGAVIGAVIYGLLKGELNRSPLMNAIETLANTM